MAVREGWDVLIKDNHPAYNSWQEYEENQRLVREKTQSGTSPYSARMKMPANTPVGSYVDDA